jgi:hypothetical protein
MLWICVGCVWVLYGFKVLRIRVGSVCGLYAVCVGCVYGHR